MKKFLVLSIASPLLCGVYDENYKLIDEISYEGFASDVLPKIYREMQNKYEFDEIFYIKGPGSFMAIKICYVFLKTICITKNMKFFASDGFLFNQNKQIKAIGKKAFIKNENNEIILVDSTGDFGIFKLPNILEKNNFNDDCLPQYILPAV